jgi:predicted metal-binding protein
MTTEPHTPTAVEVKAALHVVSTYLCRAQLSPDTERCGDLIDLEGTTRRLNTQAQDALFRHLSNRMLRAEAEVRRQNRKIAHGCTDASCAECDTDG